MKDLKKYLSIEFEGKEDYLLIDNLWWCSLDQAENEFKYNTADDTMHLKTIKLDNVDRIRVYITYHKDENPKCEYHDDMFDWNKDFEKNFRKWEEE